MTTHLRTIPTSRLLWISDLHLDQARDKAKIDFYKELENTRCDAVLITGDISTSRHLIEHLAEISRVFGKITVMFMLGNHDYFGSSFAEVDRSIGNLCENHENLVPLGYGEIIELSPRTALVGHRGFYDGLAGAGPRTKVSSPDRHLISDFFGLDRSGYFQKLRNLGEESADYFRRVLPAALKRYETVILGTHVPPFTQSLRHSGSYCNWESQPFFSNRSTGNAIVGICRNFPCRSTIVFAGHSHSPSTVQVLSNLEIRVAGAQPGRPAINEILNIQ